MQYRTLTSDHCVVLQLVALSKLECLLQQPCFSLHYYIFYEEKCLNTQVSQRLKTSKQKHLDIFNLQIVHIYILESDMTVHTNKGMITPSSVTYWYWYSCIGLEILGCVYISEDKCLCINTSGMYVSCSQWINGSIHCLCIFSIWFPYAIVIRERTSHPSEIRSEIA